MVDYREILRLSDQGYSQRQIETSVGSSRHTISEVLETANAKGIKWPLEDDVSNEDLQGILFPEKYASTSGYMEPDYERIHAELAKPGVTLTLLWAEYNEKCISTGKRPYMMTQFGDKYRRWARITESDDADPSQARRRYGSRLGGTDAAGVRRRYRRGFQSISFRRGIAV